MVLLLKFLPLLVLGLDELLVEGDLLVELLDLLAVSSVLLLEGLDAAGHALGAALESPHGLGNALGEFGEAGALVVLLVEFELLPQSPVHGLVLTNSLLAFLALGLAVGLVVVIFGFAGLF